VWNAKSQGRACLPIHPPSSLGHFTTVQRGLEALGISYAVDKCLVRGLDYYRHTVWEFAAPDALGAQATVLAGGRYTDLCRELGGPDVPGVGYALAQAPPRHVPLSYVSADYLESDCHALMCHIRASPQVKQMFWPEDAVANSGLTGRGG
jgi:histidyl-tRNA synthetase